MNALTVAANQFNFMDEARNFVRGGFHTSERCGPIALVQSADVYVQGESPKTSAHDLGHVSSSGRFAWLETILRVHNFEPRNIIMSLVYDRDRAATLHANPALFIEASKLLERLLSSISAYPMGKRVMLHAQIEASLADDLAAWGADLTDVEQCGDLEDGHDIEGVYY